MGGLHSPCCSAGRFEFKPTDCSCSHSQEIRAVESSSDLRLAPYLPQSSVNRSERSRRKDSQIKASLTVLIVRQDSDRCATLDRTDRSTAVNDSFTNVLGFPKEESKRFSHCGLPLNKNG